MSQTKSCKTRLTRKMLEDELGRARIRRVNVTDDMLTLYLDEYVSVRSILLGRQSAEQLRS